MFILSYTILYYTMLSYTIYSIIRILMFMWPLGPGAEAAPEPRGPLQGQRRPREELLEVLLVDLNKGVGFL